MNTYAKEEALARLDLYDAAMKRLKHIASLLFDIAEKNERCKDSIKEIVGSLWIESEWESADPNQAHLDALVTKCNSEWYHAIENLAVAISSLSEVAAQYGMPTTPFTKGGLLMSMTANDEIVAKGEDFTDRIRHAGETWRLYLNGSEFPDDAALRLRAAVERPKDPNSPFTIDDAAKAARCPTQTIVRAMKQEKIFLANGESLTTTAKKTASSTNIDRESFLNWQKARRTKSQTETNNEVERKFRRITSD